MRWMRCRWGAVEDDGNGAGEDDGNGTGGGLVSVSLIVLFTRSAKGADLSGVDGDEGFFILGNQGSDPGLLLHRRLESL